MSRVSNILCPVSNRALKDDYLGNRVGRHAYRHLATDVKVMSNPFIEPKDQEQEYAKLVQVTIIAM